MYEQLPTVMFIALGLLLVAVGIVRLVATFWTQYGSDIWTGVMVDIEHPHQ